MTNIKEAILSVCSWAKIEGLKTPIADAWAGSDKLHHDPIRGHYTEDRGNGKSTFVENIVAVVPKHEPIVSNDAVQIIAFHGINDVVGFDSYVRAVNPEAKVIVVNTHGCLQLQSANSSEWEIVEDPTKVLHVVLTNEGEAGWVVASVCPGLPAERTFSDWSNGKFKEGDSINIQELPFDLQRRVIIK